MDVLVLIDKLDDLVHNAKPVPLTDQVRVDKEEIYDILDQMRATIPEEIKQARWIVKERQEMLAEAKREAERDRQGGARASRSSLISEEEVTKQAERAAEDIIEDARAREREIRLGAEDYADEILNTLEVNLSKFIAAVQRGRDRLAGARTRAGRGRLRALAPRARGRTTFRSNGPGAIVLPTGRRSAKTACSPAPPRRRPCCASRSGASRAPASASCRSGPSRAPRSCRRSRSTGRLRRRSRRSCRSCPDGRCSRSSPP